MGIPNFFKIPNFYVAVVSDPVRVKSHGRRLSRHHWQVAYQQANAGTRNAMHRDIHRELLIHIMA